MKSCCFIFVIVVVCFCCLLNGSDLGNKNLSGLGFIIVSAEFNDVVVGEISDDPKDEKIEEYGFVAAAKNLETAKIPLTIEDIRKMHGQLVAKIAVDGLQVLKVTTENPDDDTTVIPTLNAEVSIVPGQGDMYCFNIHLTLAKWMSNWSGGQRNMSPVYSWSSKYLLFAPAKTLAPAIQAGLDQLIDEFLKEYRAANGITASKNKNSKSIKK